MVVEDDEEGVEVVDEVVEAKVVLAKVFTVG